MLDTLRKGANTLAAKLLFGLLVIAFAIWGIGSRDIFSAGQNYVAKVGEVKIAPQTLTNEYQRMLAQLRPQFGGKLDPDQAKQMGLPRLVLNQLESQALLDQAAQDLGIAVSDDVIYTTIKGDPAFQGPGQKFDDLTFRQQLAQAGITEQAFVAKRRAEIARDILTGTVRLSGHTPKMMAEALYRLREEKRVIDKVEIPDTAFTNIKDPDDATLAAYHKEHAATFTAPEYRAVTYLALTPADLAKDIQVSDEDLRQAYEDNKSHYAIPELRTLEQMVLANEDAAKHAADMLSQGKDFAAVAKEVAGADKDAIELGAVSKEQLPKELQDPAFAVPQDGVTQPIQDALGWHILKTVAIKPGSMKTFDEVKDELRESIAEERAVDKISKEADELEDTLASGASLEDTAQKLGLKTVAVAAVDSQGRDDKGDPITSLPRGPFVTTAFATPEGKTSTRIESSDNGYFVMRVDKIAPSALRPLEGIRDVVIAVWRDEQARKAAKARADEIASQIKAGKSLADATSAYHYDVETTTPIKRGEAEALPQTLVTDLFKEPEGGVATAETKTGAIVAQVKKIEAADPAADKPGVTALQRQLDATQGTDFLDQYGLALQNRYPITVHTKTFDALF